MKIKCLLATVAIISFMCIPAQAQDETRHEVSISYGAVPNSLWIDIVGDFIPAMAGATYEHSKVVGPIGLEYHYRISRVVGVGAIATFSKHNEDEIMGDLLTTSSKNSYFTLMPSMKFNWLRRGNWGLYSKIAAGASLRHCSMDKTSLSEKTKSSENEVFFNFQVSAIGIEAGNQNVLGFAELGVGEQGVALAGVRFKF